MNKEIEIKIQITSEQLKNLQTWLDKNAKFVEKIEHKEHYLDNPNDSFYFINSEGKKEATCFFRIRMTKNGDSACYKNWHKDETGKTTHCDEVEIKLIDGNEMLNLFYALGYETKYTIEKSRKIYLVDKFEIVIDNIKNYGIFVEVELKDQVANVQAGIENIYDLLRKIKITKFKKQIRGGGEMEEVCL